jgi:exonuclease III
VQNYSVPTLINADAMHAAEMRLDYALASRALSDACAASSWLARDRESEQLSDHYPLLTDLDCESW